MIINDVSIIYIKKIIKFLYRSSNWNTTVFLIPTNACCIRGADVHGRSLVLLFSLDAS